jgi:AcrR family transcriptional regulator
MTTSDKIKEVALKLFAYNGYEGTSIADIALEVGIKKASIYSHIKNKEELYVSLLEDVLRWDREYFSSLMDKNLDKSVMEKLHLIFINYCTIYQKDPERTKNMFLNRTMLFPPEFLREKLQQIFKFHEASFDPILTKVINEGLEKGIIRGNSVNSILLFFYCTVDGLFVESRYYTADEFKEKTDPIWSMLWQALERHDTATISS